MEAITQLGLDTLRYQLETGKPLDRELVARLYVSHYRNVNKEDVEEEFEQETVLQPQEHKTFTLPTFQ